MIKDVIMREVRRQGQVAGGFLKIIGLASAARIVGRFEGGGSPVGHAGRNTGLGLRYARPIEKVGVPDDRERRAAPSIQRTDLTLKLRMRGDSGKRSLAGIISTA